jgi:hypothetical protein
MATTFQSQTLSVSVRRDPREVYEFVVAPENLPQWATAFCKSIRQSDGKWLMETAEGEVTVRFVEKNDFGVADHYLNAAADVELYVPMRIVQNSSGSEVLLTLFRQPGISPSDFGFDVGLVTRDLNRLKNILEA